MLKEGFGFYYVHVYTLDPERRMLHLRAWAVCQAVRCWHADTGSLWMLTRVFVAQAARTHKLVTVNDVTTTPAFLPNSLLPDTRSELALPMIVGEDVIELDVQHDRVDAFTPVYQDVLLRSAVRSPLRFRMRVIERIAQSLKETQIRLTITQALGEAQTVHAVIDTVMNHGDAPEGVPALLALAEGDLGRAGFRAVGHLPPWDSAWATRTRCYASGAVQHAGLRRFAWQATASSVRSMDQMMSGFQRRRAIC